MSDMLSSLHAAMFSGFLRNASEDQVKAMVREYLSRHPDDQIRLRKLLEAGIAGIYFK